VSVTLVCPAAFRSPCHKKFVPSHIEVIPVGIVELDGTVATVSCRWLIDATGRQAMLARQRGGVTPIDSHPTAAIWVASQGPNSVWMTRYALSSVAGLVLLAAAVSLRFFRFGGVQRMILSGVGGGFLLYVLSKVTDDLSKAELMHPIAAAWLPVVVGGLTGLVALLYQEDG